MNKNNALEELMGMSKPIGNDRPYFKAGFEGFGGTGKTHTMSKLAIGIHKKINAQKHIHVVDTEGGFRLLKPLFNAAGIQTRVTNTKQLATLTQVIKLCEDAGVEILLIDSLTHIYQQFIQDYLKTKKRINMKMLDWGYVKPKWREDFANVFVNAKLHIMFTGRAGFEYDMVENEEGKKEMIKTNIKMKVDNETAFEPDFLFLMEKQENLANNKKQLKRTCFVVKDRTNTIDGKTFTNPTFRSFLPAVKRVLDGNLDQQNDQPGVQ